jgi:hypothetical protein
MIKRADSSNTIGPEMVLHLLHINSEFAQVLNEGVLLVHHCLNLLFRLKVPISWLIQFNLVYLNRHVSVSTSET